MDVLLSGVLPSTPNGTLSATNSKQKGILVLLSPEVGGGGFRLVLLIGGGILVPFNSWMALDGYSLFLDGFARVLVIPGNSWRALDGFSLILKGFEWVLFVPAG